MRLFVLFTVSWAIGVATYWVVGSILDAHMMGSGDLSAAALYSGVMFAITAPVIYLPAMMWVRRRATRRSALVVMTIMTLLHTVVATALVIAAFGGFRLSALLKPEAVLFYVIFGTAGVVLGVVYLSWYRHKPEFRKLR
jgi:hypothetical protein